MDCVLFDHDRTRRIGLPEAVFCQGKHPEAVRGLLRRFGGLEPGQAAGPVLFTRLEPEVFRSFRAEEQALADYHELSRTAVTGRLPRQERGRVAVVSAGTADGAVAWEAARTLDYLGLAHTVFEDSGVAGLWRLSGRLEEINGHDVVIVVAGLDAALASVLGGLSPRPVFAVPTSVGYGMAESGRAALASMLVSCAPGVAVLNIDNGYGAACAAARVANLLCA